MYVDLAGEWKLGGVEYIQPLEPPPGSEDINVLAMLLPALQVYDPPEGRKYTKTNKRVQKWYDLTLLYMYILDLCLIFL